MISNRYAKETAKAWGMSYKQVKRIHEWTERKIPPHYRSLVFTKLLRRNKNSNKQLK